MGDREKERENKAKIETLEVQRLMKEFLSDCVAGN